MENAWAGMQVIIIIIIIVMMKYIHSLAFQEYWESRGTESDPWHECGSTQVFNDIDIFENDFHEFGPDDGFPIF